MLIKEIHLRNWRNLEPATLTLPEGITVISGENGQGKTNLLEAVFSLVTFRSFRTNTLAEAVRWGERKADIHAKLSVHGIARTLDLKVEDGKKTASLDDKVVRRDSESLNAFSVVVFSPEDLKLVKTAPSERRKFLDRIVFSGNRKYAKSAIQYSRSIKARNNLLRLGKRGPLLESYDELLAASGAEIIRERRDVTGRLHERARLIFKELHSDLDLDIAYQAKAGMGPEPGNEAAYLREAYRKSLEKDLERRFTSVGPHQDDLRIKLKGVDAEKHASQGQIRSIVLSLKIAELQIVREKNQENPLFLLDDIASELDTDKRGRLIDVVKNLGCQSLISVTENDQVPHTVKRNDMDVKNGQIQGCPPPG